MACSAIYILDMKGKVLLSRNYRGDIENSVIDTATFNSGLTFAEGIEYVLVNGVLVVDEGESVEGVLPGQPLLGRFAQ